MQRAGEQRHARSDLPGCHVRSNSDELTAARQRGRRSAAVRP